MLNSGDPTNIWAWIESDEKRLEKKGGRWQAILEGYYDFWRNYHSDHIGAELAINQALEAARETRELKWELHLRHWRLQLWLSQQQVKRALPEAVDLLSLATDPQVRDVPQRICAYHDIVECYVSMDAAGYYQEIVENSQDVLAQLPRRHPCATCARSNLARTAAASGRTEEAEHWLNQTRASLSERRHASLVEGFGDKYALIGKWDEAEMHYLEARNLASSHKQADSYLSATLSLVQVYVEQKNYPRASEALNEGRQLLKSYGGTYLLARQLEVEGRFIAAAAEQKEEALDFLTRAASFYLELGRYRDAADTALYAAELARTHALTQPESALAVAARAVGQLPPTSQDLAERLASFGREPLPPESEGQEALTAEQVDRNELTAMEELLRAHIERHHFSDTCVTLSRIGRWYGNHEQMRAGIDYLIFSAALERLLKLSQEERQDALGVLSNLNERLPDGAVEAALSASEAGPPSWLTPLLKDMPPERWQWIIRCLRAEIAGQPVVEPEPENGGSQDNFYSWLNHNGSMTALILRFSDQVEPVEREQWARSMDESAREIEQHIQQLRQQQPDIPEQALEPATIVRGFAALTRGASVAEAEALVAPTYVSLISQTAEMAQTPIWFHPESSPLDFLVEQMSQKAVRALRHYDENRPTRLANLALRYRLMTIDLRKHEPLRPIADFLDALRALVLSDGQQLPTRDTPLEAPFDAVLAAVMTAGQNTNPTE
ncbi:hypothetical protein [Dictyobacter aurantiacus]|uniref:Uncharacterized protein n=1 Tax=Dictyobacter aurantiacus TaxID=1936993 RepID=A0A401ZKT9_9CHLR|nr:hypothetical protein [Dictyobacter aurantiacus]GCE07430.1 hypothetical protein KDAU_47590 [Dictyobacter aurantiacus]